MMLSFAKLNKQNEEIEELSDVLQYLIKNKKMCNSKVTCDLFLTYTKEVINHLYIEETEVYRYLLNHEDFRVRNTVCDFFNGSLEIKRIFNEYLGKWCKNKILRVNNHSQFVVETREIFDFVLKRLNAETTILYPIVKKALADKVAA